mmetsp:Transcript_87455/g.248425  ORF Transcript_87455/g.248425 Transcript_87455/m.248425 type:complete len:209 (-) Transcript_87455:10-636(-)
MRSGLCAVGKLQAETRAPTKHTHAAHARRQSDRNKSRAADQLRPRCGAYSVRRSLHSGLYLYDARKHLSTSFGASTTTSPFLLPRLNLGLSSIPSFSLKLLSGGGGAFFLASNWAKSAAASSSSTFRRAFAFDAPAAIAAAPVTTGMKIERRVQVLRATCWPLELMVSAAAGATSMRQRTVMMDRIALWARERRWCSDTRASRFRDGS